MLIILILSQSAVTQFQGKAPFTGGVNTLGNLRFSTEITVYLGNGTRLVHGYNGSLIGSHR